MAVYSTALSAEAQQKQSPRRNSPIISVAHIRDSHLRFMHLGHCQALSTQHMQILNLNLKMLAVAISGAI